MVDQFEFDLSIYRNLSLEEIIDNPCMFFINNYITIYTHLYSLISRQMCKGSPMPNYIIIMRGKKYAKQRTGKCTPHHDIFVVRERYCLTHTYIRYTHGFWHRPKAHLPVRPRDRFCALSFVGRLFFFSLFLSIL